MTGFLASLSICLGVMTLVVVVSVMNGFQMGFIESIMEISSAHIRVVPGDGFDSGAFAGFCRDEANGVVACEPFYEAQTLMAGSDGRQSPALVRAVSPGIMETDAGFAGEVRIVSGSFNLARDDAVVLGSELARSLGVRTGDTVSLLALSGGSDVDLISDSRVFVVAGIFTCGYAEINAAYSFIPLGTGGRLFGKDAAMMYNIKLADSDSDERVIQRLAAQVPGVEAESWRSYNRSFFGALRIEKNLLMMLVLLIFVVVGVNIFNGMRRMVFERRAEIAVLSALGGRKRHVRMIFTIRGLVTGLLGAVPGLMLGLLLCVRMDSVFMLISRVTYWFQYFATMLTDPAMAVFVRENPMYQVYARIPARIMPLEVLFITVFGVFSALAASWNASRGIQSLSVSEVLHDE